MIQTENITIRERHFIHTYSDAGMKIRQNETGVIYDDAYDPIDSGRTYTETDEPIEPDDSENVDDIIDELKGRW